MNHYFLKYIGELNPQNWSQSDEYSKTICELDYQCSLLDNARKNGYGYETHLKKVKKLLENLAQNADISNTRIRNTLEAFWNSLPDEMPYQTDRRIAYEALEMRYNEHTTLFSVKLPPLLPYKMIKGANYLHDQIVFNIRGFHEQWYAERGSLIRITPSAVIFIHCAKHGEWRNIRDYDNLEKKRVLDALQICGMFSDNPSRMVELNMMAWAQTSCTLIQVTRLENLKNLLESLDFSAYESASENDRKPTQNTSEKLCENEE